MIYHKRPDSAAKFHRLNRGPRRVHARNMRRNTRVGMMPGTTGGTWVALQLRIIDGIRTRVVQIEDRDGTRPVRIGSAPDCDIRVGAGAPVQCEMFIHHGRWVVKNALPNAPIRVGGKVVSKGAYLSAEDRISLGDSERAAVIEVGPVAVAAGGIAARPTAPDAIAELTHPGGGETWFQEDADEMVSLGVGGGRGAMTRPRGHVNRKPGGAIGWTVLFAAVVLAGAG